MSSNCSKSTQIENRHTMNGIFFDSLLVVCLKIKKILEIFKIFVSLSTKDFVTNSSADNTRNLLCVVEDYFYNRPFKDIY